MVPAWPLPKKDFGKVIGFINVLKIAMKSLRKQITSCFVLLMSAWFYVAVLWIFSKTRLCIPIPAKWVMFIMVGEFGICWSRMLKNLR